MRNVVLLLAVSVMSASIMSGAARADASASTTDASSSEIDDSSTDDSSSTGSISVLPTLDADTMTLLIDGADTVSSQGSVFERGSRLFILRATPSSADALDTLVGTGARFDLDITLDEAGVTSSYCEAEAVLALEDDMGNQLIRVNFEDCDDGSGSGSAWNIEKSEIF
ncbi:MAG: hypothetical protein AAFV53_08375 [Myxococcota bacterium]